MSPLGRNLADWISAMVAVYRDWSTEEMAKLLTINVIGSNEVTTYQFTTRKAAAIGARAVYDLDDKQVLQLEKEGKLTIKFAELFITLRIEDSTS